MTCGFGYPTRTMTQMASDDWLKCLPVTNLARRIPKCPSGEMWIDGDNQKFSRSEYLIKYGVDPKINWEYRHGSKGANAQMRF
jgi:hypothetical protein